MLRRNSNTPKTSMSAALTYLTLREQASALERAGGTANLFAAVTVYDHIIKITTISSRGEDDPHILALLGKARLLGKLDGSANLSAAVTLYDRVIKIRMATFGPGHPQTAEILQLKAVTLMQMGGSNVDTAVALFTRVIKIISATLGADHPTLAWTLHHKASALCGMRGSANLSEAVALFDRVIEIATAAGDADVPQPAMILHEKAAALMLMGGSANLLEAIALFDRVVEIRMATMGADGPYTRLVMNHKATALAKLEACTKSGAASSNRKSEGDFDVVPMGFNSMGWKPFPVGDFIEVYSDNMRIVALTADEATAVVAELFEPAAHGGTITAKASKPSRQKADHPSKAAVHAKMKALAHVDSVNLGALWRQIGCDTVPMR
jgi:hypothetical protein